MYSIHTFRVVPSLPEKLRPLLEIANNMWWCWNHEAVELFHRLDRERWETSNHNPVLLLGSIDQETLLLRAEDDSFVATMETVYREFKSYMEDTGWFASLSDVPTRMLTAYFSMEFGINECMPIYSGGLGVLAGDHLKSASDMGVPMVGVGLLYTEGYFQQYLSKEGWQQEFYPLNDPFNMPVTLIKDNEGRPIEIEVEYPEGKAVVRMWRLQVGRVPLVMLDTDYDKNQRIFRELTTRLYFGDAEMRIRQEILLGIGGMRALKRLDRNPLVCHINEGHSAFLTLERVRMIMAERGLKFSEALEIVRASNVFTTHTCVAAGIDKFQPALVNRFLGGYLASMGIGFEELDRLGRAQGSESPDLFCMPILALRTAGYRNGVSKLHEKVSQKLWQPVWTNVPQHEIPITAITNGIHARTWLSRELSGLFDRYLGPRWKTQPANNELWERINQIPDAELWRTHERRRERLVAFCRHRLRRRIREQGSAPGEISRADEILDPEALTVGFARRFASYKRADLLFHDLDRLKALLAAQERPIQFIFAGKAHPQDKLGKGIISTIVKYMRDEPFRSRMVFLDNYDMNIARYMVQGVDVWLNTPRRPQEASGTSGMKAAVNGGLNLSILDGWWDEAYSGDNGWVIGKGEEYSDLDYQDNTESRAIYDLLESEIIPLFYDRGQSGLPRAWITKMKNSMRSISPVFNTNRMIKEYTERFYVPAANRMVHLLEDNGFAQSLAAWRQRVHHAWHTIQILSVSADVNEDHPVGSDLMVRAVIQSPELTPDHLAVEIYYGLVAQDNGLVDTASTEMELETRLPDGHYQYAGKIPCRASGQNGFTVRILPRHKELINKFEDNLVTWA
ncbi:alpha-glucan family phosphorylase [bacterium]|nr:alpha-glucan family phosphorylase [candidate division CSSED10-310 bacterium]